MFILHGLLDWVRGVTYCVYCRRTMFRRDTHFFHRRAYCGRECVVRDLHAPAVVAYLLDHKDFDALARTSGAV